MPKYIVAAVRAEVVHIEVEAASEEEARTKAANGDGDEIPDHPGNGPVVSLDTSGWEVGQVSCSSCDIELAEGEDVVCSRCRSEEEEHQQRTDDAIAEGERRYALAVLGDECPDWRTA